MGITEFLADLREEHTEERLLLVIGVYLLVLIGDPLLLEGYPATLDVGAELE